MNRLRLARAVGHLKHLRRGIRERVVRCLLPVGTEAVGGFETTQFGYVYSGVLSNWIDRAIYLFGDYEPEIQEILGVLSARNRDAVFVDIGANVGIHTLFASTRFRSVHAFEPFPPVRERLCSLLERNRVTNVTVHAVALGSKDEELPFFAPQDSNLGTGSFVQGNSGSNIEYRLLPVYAGDAYLRARLGRVDVIKVDVEGFEVAVLQGLRGTLARYRPAVIMELSESTRQTVGSAERLFAHFPEGYQAFELLGRRTWGGFFESLGLRLAPLSFDGKGENLLLIGSERLPELAASGISGKSP